MKVGIYGPKIGYSSLEVVTRGFEEAATAHDCFGGIAHPSMEQWSDTMESDVAICTGSLDLFQWMNNVGKHQAAHIMLAPNSTWIPSMFWSMILNLKDRERCVLTPSQWGKEVIEESAPFKMEATVVPHGVLNGHGPVLDSDTPSVQFNKGDKFLISHFAGSSLERKGTYELLKAFSCFKFMLESRLVLVVNPIEWRTLQEEVEAMGMESHVIVATRLNAPPAMMKQLYATSDMLCQPSRAEGFGLMPLEALVAGTPVAMTLETGHTQYALHNGLPIDGVIPIETGPMAEVRYDPGGMAPSVDADAIVEALEYGYGFREEFRKKAMGARDALLEKHSWKKATEPFFNELKEKN